MFGSWDPEDFPNLSPQTCRITSRETRNYNCIAWAAGCNTDWWCPGFDGYWPPGVQREISLAAFIAVFQSQGYQPCSNGDLDPGFEKVALFAQLSYDGSLTPTHAAIQLENGHWSSKLGPFEDIEHYKLESVNGPLYGAPVKFLRRKRQRKIIDQNA